MFIISLFEHVSGNCTIAYESVSVSHETTKPPEELTANQYRKTPKHHFWCKLDFFYFILELLAEAVDFFQDFITNITHFLDLIWFVKYKKIFII